VVLSWPPTASPGPLRRGRNRGPGHRLDGILRSPAAATATFGEGETFVIAHELVHTLGAVPPCGPHYGNDGHVIDDPRDLLYDGPIRVPPRAVLLDPGHDDYYRTGRHDCPDIANSPVWTN
jgi:hypothetical protein